MSKVNFQTPISSKDLQLPDLPPEEQPASDPLPKITHAKSKRGVENILKHSLDLFRKLSTHKSRVHVDMKLDKKNGASQNEESSTVHIKTRTQKKVSFSKSDPKNQPRMQNELNLAYLKNGLKKVTKDMDDNKRSDLATAIRQLLGDLGGEPDETILVELKTVTKNLSLMPEVRGASITLNKKIDEALLKKAETASKNLVKAEKITIPALDDSMLSAKAEKLQESQSKLSAPDMTLNEFMFALDKSNNIDEITNALERQGISNQDTLNQSTSALPLSADDELVSALKELNDMLKKT